MKKSHITMLIALGFMLAALLGGLITLRVIVGPGNRHASATESSGGRRSLESTGERWSEAPTLRDFDSIEIQGLWEVTVTHGNFYSLEVSYPDSWGNESTVSKRSDTLVLGHPGHHNIEESAVIEITMPGLSMISIEGAGDIRLRGFEEQSLDVNVEGGAYIKGSDTSVGRLGINLAGGGMIDFEDVRSVDAEVNLEGAGQISLFMDGGELTGRLEGVGRIVYRGTASREDIVIDGIGSVRRSS